ncbi:MAG: glycerate 2-kinase [Solirubrobacteraceae bacterium]|jgi:glycerate kinase|nr:glycerate 2-kinase [Solirubrobacteraceae bacterium]
MRASTPPPTQPPPRALVAPDSFKGTFDAATVADALARGLERAGWQVDRCPVADGGEGTMSLLAEALHGRLVPVTASDPLGRSVDCHVAIIEDMAIVETAQASGLALVAEHERDPWAASTRGTGELILAAVAAGAREILVAVGGSATTDGGRGAIDAIRAGGGLGAARLAVLSDVECAFEDAARVFGPQKGADAAMVARLEQRLAQLARALPKDPRGVRATGAAGGLSGGLWAAFDAELRPGAAAVLDALRVDERMRAAQLVVAGEGRIDEQSFGGKIVGELARRARAAGVPIHAVVGACGLPEEDWARAGLERVWTASTLTQIEAAGRALGTAAPRAS